MASASSTNNSQGRKQTCRKTRRVVRKKKHAQSSEVTEEGTARQTKHDNNKDTNNHNKKHERRRATHSACAEGDENSSVQQNASKMKVLGPGKKKEVVLPPEQEALFKNIVSHCTNDSVSEVLQNEFKQVQNLDADLDPQKHTKCCLYPEKNRFPDVTHCLDETRIILQPGPDGCKLEDDFIHANKVVVEKMDREYIAAQAPKETYVEDFWKMVFQEQSTTVIVLCSYYEEGKQVCEEFYPADAGSYRYFGKMFINNKKCETIESFQVHTLELLPEGCSNSLITRLAHTTAWKDKMFLQKCRHLMKISRWIREQDMGPVTVVSAAGCGRAGTFMSIDSCHQFLSKGIDFKVPDLVLSIRRQRAYAVDNLLQYVSIYIAVLDYIRAKDDKRFAPAYKKFSTFIKNIMQQ